jgi:hypothetical protein
MFLEPLQNLGLSEAQSPPEPEPWQRAGLELILNPGRREPKKLSELLAR